METFPTLETVPADGELVGEDRCCFCESNQHQLVDCPTAPPFDWELDSFDLDEPMPPSEDDYVLPQAHLSPSIENQSSAMDPAASTTFHYSPGMDSVTDYYSPAIGWLASIPGNIPGVEVATQNDRTDPGVNGTADDILCSLDIDVMTPIFHTNPESDPLASSRDYDIGMDMTQTSVTYNSLPLEPATSAGPIGFEFNNSIQQTPQSVHKQLSLSPVGMENPSANGSAASSLISQGSVEGHGVVDIAGRGPISATTYTTADGNIGYIFRYEKAPPIPLCSSFPTPVEFAEDMHGWALKMNRWVAGLQIFTLEMNNIYEMRAFDAAYTASMMDGLVCHMAVPYEGKYIRPLARAEHVLKGLNERWESFPSRHGFNVSPTSQQPASALQKPDLSNSPLANRGHASLSSPSLSRDFSHPTARTAHAAQNSSLGQTQKVDAIVTPQDGDQTMRDADTPQGTSDKDAKGATNKIKTVIDARGVIGGKVTKTAQAPRAKKGAADGESPTPKPRRPRAGKAKTVAQAQKSLTGKDTLGGTNIPQGDGTSSPATLPAPLPAKVDLVPSLKGASARQRENKLRALPGVLLLHFTSGPFPTSVRSFCWQDDKVVQLERTQDATGNMYNWAKILNDQEYTQALAVTVRSVNIDGVLEIPKNAIRTLAVKDEEPRTPPQGFDNHGFAHSFAKDGHNQSVTKSTKDSEAGSSNVAPREVCNHNGVGAEKKNQQTLATSSSSNCAQKPRQMCDSFGSPVDPAKSSTSPLVGNTELTNARQPQSIPGGNAINGAQTLPPRVVPTHTYTQTGFTTDGNQPNGYSSSTYPPGNDIAGSYAPAGCRPTGYPSTSYPLTGYNQNYGGYYYGRSEIGYPNITRRLDTQQSRAQQADTQYLNLHQSGAQQVHILPSNIQQSNTQQKSTPSSHAQQHPHLPAPPLQSSQTPDVVDIAEILTGEMDRMSAAAVSASSVPHQPASRIQPKKPHVDLEGPYAEAYYMREAFIRQEVSKTQAAKRQRELAEKAAERQKEKVDETG